MREEKDRERAREREREEEEEGMRGIPVVSSKRYISKSFGVNNEAKEDKTN